MDQAGTPSQAHMQRQQSKQVIDTGTEGSGETSYDLPLYGHRPHPVSMTSEPILDSTSRDYYHVQRDEAVNNDHARYYTSQTRGYPRSYSPAATTMHAPPMARTRSLPIVTAAVGSYSPSPSQSPRQMSPHRMPGPPRTAARRSLEETRPPSSGALGFMEIETIGEDSELDLTPRLGSTLDRDTQTTIGHWQQHSYNTFPRNSGALSRRRPASPLHQLYSPPPSTPLSPNTASTTSFTSPTVPLVQSASLTSSNSSSSTGKYNEAYPSPFSTTSSMPSTPTSFRSRSPSISSLETIPDSPDAEEAAMEAFNIADLKAAADAADAEDAAEADRTRRRGSGGSLEGHRLMSRDKRKRWSVCGAERRGDFEMETIWEDGG